VCTHLQEKLQFESKLQSRERLAKELLRVFGFSPFGKDIISLG